MEAIFKIQTWFCAGNVVYIYLVTDLCRGGVFHQQRARDVTELRAEYWGALSFRSTSITVTAVRSPSYYAGRYREIL